MILAVNSKTVCRSERFLIVINLTKAQVDHAVDIADSHRGAAAPKRMIKKILLVEDQAEIRKLLRMILNAEHYDLHEAVDTQMALDMMATIKPDLLLLDIMLPLRPESSTPQLVSGLDLCRLLKSMPEYAALPIILLTAKGQLADRAAGIAAGADDYLVKPFRVQELTEIIEFHLARTHAS
jgi:DNA-binding response OmpR family regulator